jgi:hypothetical protein
MPLSDDFTDKRTVTYRYPNSFMVAPADDRSTSHFEIHRPRPRTFKPKANILANPPDFPEPNFDFSRIDVDAAHSPKHPGLYQSTLPSSARGSWPPPSPTTHYSHSRKNKKVATKQVPPVAAHFSTSFSDFSPRTVRHNAPAMAHATPTPSNKPYNSKSNPATRHAAFKADVWQKLNAHDRATYHNRLTYSKVAVNKLLRRRIKNQRRRMNKKLRKASSSAPPVSDNYKSTNPAKCPPTMSTKYSNHSSRPPTRDHDAKPITPHRVIPKFSLKHYTLGTNILTEVITIKPSHYRLYNACDMWSLTNLTKHIQNNDIVILVDGFYNNKHQCLTHRFFYSKSIVLLPQLIPITFPTIHNILNMHFENRLYGKDVYTHHRLRLPPQRHYHERPTSFPRRQYAFMATTTTDLHRPVTRSQTSQPTEPTTHPIPTDPNNTPTTDPPTGPPDAPTMVETDIQDVLPPTVTQDEAPETQPTSQTQNQTSNDTSTLPSEPPATINLTTTVPAIDPEEASLSESSVDTNLFELEEPTTDVPPPKSSPTPSYRHAFRPPTPPRKSPDDSVVDLQGWQATTNLPTTSTLNPNAKGFAFKLCTTVPLGTIPKIHEYTLLATSTYIDGLTSLYFDDFNLDPNHPEVAYPFFKILTDILHVNIVQQRRDLDYDEALNVWAITRLIGKVACTVLEQLPRHRNFDYLRLTFPMDYTKYERRFDAACQGLGIYLPYIPEPLFNDMIKMCVTNRDNASPHPILPTVADIPLSTNAPVMSPSADQKPKALPVTLDISAPPSAPSVTPNPLPCPPNVPPVASMPQGGDDDPSSSDNDSADDDSKSKRKPSKHSSFDHHPNKHPHRRPPDDDDNNNFGGYSSSSGKSSNASTYSWSNRRPRDTEKQDPHNTSSKRLKTKEKKMKSNDITDLTSKLLKAAKNIGMKSLDLVSDPMLRRTRFNTWSTHLRIVLNSFPETQYMFKDLPTIHRINYNVDSCVYQLILAKCGSAAMNSLESTDHTSGYQAYIDLQRQCAQVSEHLQQTAHQALLTMTWSDHDTATNFLIRFRSALSKCQHLGLRFTEHQKVNYFFAISHRLTRSSVYYVRIETLRAHRNLQNEPMTLADIETNLYGLDEEFNNNKNSSSIRKTYKEEAAMFTKSYGPHAKHNRKPFKKSTTSNVTCHYCHKPGHIAPECRQKQCDQGTTPTSNFSHQRPHQQRGAPSTKPPHSRPNPHRATPSQYKSNRPTQPPTCYKCGQTGHYANACPNPSKQPSSNHRPNQRAMLADNNEYSHFSVDTKVPNSTYPHQMNINATPTAPQHANRASTVHFGPSQQMLMMAHLALPRKHFYHQKWWKLHPTETQHPPKNDFKNYIPDSGATSHFTPVEEDLIDPVDCHVPILLADGNTVFATKIGYSHIHFITDQGQSSTLYLAHVHYVPGLNHRLFSLQAFTRHTNHKAEIKDTNTTLLFEDGDTFTWPYVPQDEPFDAYIENANTVQDLPNAVPNDIPITPPDTVPLPCPHIDPTATPNTPDVTTIQPFVSSNQVRPTKTIPLEKALIRFGFRSSRGILAGTYYNLWDDYQIRPGFDSFSTSLRIAISRTHNISRDPFDIPPVPFALLFMDIIPTPRMRALSVSSAYPASLLVVDAYTRYSMWIGLPATSTENIIEALQHFFARTRSQGRTSQVNYIRTDAGSYFTSAPFATWCRTVNIHLTIAAPHHQEMNSICERQWQTINQLARVCLVHARLPLEYFHFAVLYAVAIINVLPAKGVNDNTGTPTCPHTLAFGKRPKIGNFRVFGCPAAIKHYTTSTSTGKANSDLSSDFTTTPKPLQRAVRGIFIGYPEHQAGWLFYLPNPLGRHNFITSRDAVFDESFESTLAHVHAPYSGAMPERASTPLLDHLDVDEPSVVPIQSTGNVAHYPYRLPVTGEEGEVSENRPEENFEDDPEITEPILHDSNIDQYDPLDTDVHDMTSDTTAPKTTPQLDDDPPETPPVNVNAISNPRRSQRTTRGQRSSKLFADEHEELYNATASFQHPLRAMVAITQNGNDNDQPIDLFLPEPTCLKAVLRLPLEIRRLWMHAVESEIQTLIDNDTFDTTQQPQHGEQIIPIKLIYKAKQRSDGCLDKLKVRAVQRADLQWYKPEEDTWSPCASSWGVRMFLAEIARRGRTAKLLDFIGAYLQGHAVGRHWVRFPVECAQFFPKYAKYFGIALLLKKGMYGGTLSGKWWNQELTEWLLSVGFIQSSLDATYFVKIYPDGSFVRLIFHVDDMLYFGNNNEVERLFESEIKGRFNVNVLGQAHWFLQMRIHHHADKSISFDQHRFVLNLLQRFVTIDSPYGIPKFRDTPAPPEYVFSIENRPVTQEDHDAIKKKYPGLDFRSCLCTILYLAYSTRADILFIVCKLAKACIHPGLKDFDALFWLLGYLRKYPAYGIRFYHNVSKSPVHELLQEQKIETNEIVAFSDASWQDCPDTGRSTIGYLIFYQGGIVAAASTVPRPVAMSSAEAEYMAACAASMNAAVIRSLLYDMRYLGTNQYQLLEPEPESNENNSSINASVQFQPAILCVDNAAAVAMSESPKLTKKTRHIARHFHFVRDGVKRGLHVLRWISNKAQLADVLTKTQCAAKTDPQVNIFMFQLPEFLVCHTSKGDLAPALPSI